MRMRIKCVALIAALVLLIPTQSASAAETLLGTFSVGTAEDALFSADGSTVWIISHSDQKIYKYSTATRTVLGNVSLGGNAYAGAMSLDGSKIYVALINASQVVVVNTAALTKTTIATSGVGWGITMAPAGDYVYVSENGGIVQKISTATDSIVTTVTLPTTGQLRDMKMSQNGTFLYVTDYTSSELYKLNASDLSVSGSLTLSRATFIALAPDDSYGFVMPYTGSNLYKFSTANMTLTSTISGFSSAAEAMFSNDGQFLYVQNAGNGSFSKMRLSDNTVTSTFGSASATAWRAALSPNGNELYQMSTAGTVYVYDLGNPIIVTLSLTLPSSATYRTSTLISIGVSSGTGKVTFQANGKNIPGCIKVQVSSLSASCSFKPSTHGGISITATYSDSSGTTTQKKTLAVKARTGNR